MYPKSHCISVYLICKGEYLLLRRKAEYLKGTWQMVTGGINEGEKAYTAALRELEEETGVIPDSFYSGDAVETFYMKVIDKIAFVPVFVAFIKEKPLIKLTEHDAFLWLSFEEAHKKLLFAEQKRVITHIQEAFVLQQPSSFHLIYEK
ncbi:MAG: NUDIX domain-containing protein [Chlamydiota bacterium]